MSAAARRLFDRATLLLMVAGLALLLQPWWVDGFRVGFFATLAGVLLQTVAGHLPAGKVAGQLHHPPSDEGAS
ncbi:MAG: hypothetical protein JNL90_15950 [Planctomycetes bacterium]|nr:hypothetical protein [Planctomycetota bacterium]